MSSGGGPPKQAKSRPLLQDGGGDNAFTRALGSVDYHTREHGLQAMSAWLARATVDELGLLKLWRGAFYAFWHSDKQPIQVCRACSRVAPASKGRPCTHHAPAWSAVVGAGMLAPPNAHLPHAP